MELIKIVRDIDAGKIQIIFLPGPGQQVSFPIYLLWLTPDRIFEIQKFIAGETTELQLFQSLDHGVMMCHGDDDIAITVYTWDSHSRHVVEEDKIVHLLQYIVDMKGW